MQTYVHAYEKREKKKKNECVCVCDWGENEFFFINIFSLSECMFARTIETHTHIVCSTLCISYVIISHIYCCNTGKRAPPFRHITLRRP